MALVATKIRNSVISCVLILVEMQCDGLVRLNKYLKVQCSLKKNLVAYRLGITQESKAKQDRKEG